MLKGNNMSIEYMILKEIKKTHKINRDLMKELKEILKEMVKILKQIYSAV